MPVGRGVQRDFHSALWRDGRRHRHGGRLRGGQPADGGKLLPAEQDAAPDRAEGKRKVPWEILKKALKIGLPVAAQEIAICGAMVVSTIIIAPLGAVSIAAHSFAITAEVFCYMPGYGIGMAATTLVGRCVGAGQEQLAKRYGNICTAMGALFMGVTGALMMLICPLVFRVLTPDPAVRQLAAEVLRIGLIAEPLYGVSIVAAGALRGGRYVCTQHTELSQHLGGASGAGGAAGGPARPARHVDRHGGGAVRPRPADALSAEKQRNIFPSTETLLSEAENS